MGRDIRTAIFALLLIGGYSYACDGVKVGYGSFAWSEDPIYQGTRTAVGCSGLNGLDILFYQDREYGSTILATSNQTLLTFGRWHFGYDIGVLVGHDPVPIVPVIMPSLTCKGFRALDIEFKLLGSKGAAIVLEIRR